MPQLENDTGRVTEMKPVDMITSETDMHCVYGVYKVSLSKWSTQTETP